METTVDKSNSMESIWKIGVDATDDKRIVEPGNGPLKMAGMGSTDGRIEIDGRAIEESIVYLKKFPLNCANGN